MNYCNEFMMESVSPITVFYKTTDKFAHDVFEK